MSWYRDLSLFDQTAVSVFAGFAAITLVREYVFYDAKRRGLILPPSMLLSWILPALFVVCFASALSGAAVDYLFARHPAITGYQIWLELRALNADQFLRGMLSDIFEVFDVRFSNVELGALSIGGKLGALGMRLWTEYYLFKWIVLKLSG